MASDFYVAMRYAKKMVWSLGMGKSGLIGDFQALSERGVDLVSEKTKEMLNADVQDILQTCLREVEEVLNKNRELFDFFAQELYQKEDLEYDQILDIFQRFGVRPAKLPSILEEKNQNQ